MRFIARTDHRHSQSVTKSADFVAFPFPPSTRTLKQLRAHDLVDEEETGRGDRKYRTCARANRGLYEYRGWSEKDP